ncbi:unnamed protein product [Didymodactylos carnosus]|uniref:Guanylate cyclase domain-containing protein n=1 Tax=Didymodactylos carnosus TaxID=1234261 RepID=A0A813ZL84_9BILA|nr:unnamed protein product [Didymodactylos carnosus]CAF1335628.1 unnamed protein product [Didymodactylos carnosus]CAF3683619.1 unnamed protein product [Didymodactylos carnosus]CAF4146614.1 unnamed protein product [Didymodactylos carnosus]
MDLTSRSQVQVIGPGSEMKEDLINSALLSMNCNQLQFISSKPSTFRPSNQSRSFIYQLPDIVVQRKRHRRLPYAEHFNGILLFSDVSGFTEMCQKYSTNIDKGVNQLASSLNEYLAPIVEAILRENGDIYKFAGDAVLALWPFKNDTIEHKREQAQHVLSCALHMKRMYCDYPTSIGTILNIKSAIATGPFSMFFLRGITPQCAQLLSENPNTTITKSSIRNLNVSSIAARNQSAFMGTLSNKQLTEQCRSALINYYVCYGDGVKMVNKCQYQCGSQDIIMDVTTWDILDAASDYYFKKFIIPVEIDDDQFQDEQIHVTHFTPSHNGDEITHGSLLNSTTVQQHRLPPLPLPIKSTNFGIMQKRTMVETYIRIQGKKDEDDTQLIRPTDVDLSIFHQTDDRLEEMNSSIKLIQQQRNILSSSSLSNRSPQRQTQQKRDESTKTSFSLNSKSAILSRHIANHYGRESTTSKRLYTEEQMRALRSTAFIDLNHFDSYDLSTFIIKPVKDRILDQDSLDHLSELRLINIVFIQILLADSEKALPTKLQTIVDCSTEQISITNGILTKIFMFDKGLSLLCAFGLPGYKHPDDAERALKFGFLLSQRLGT